MFLHAGGPNGYVWMSITFAGIKSNVNMTFSGSNAMPKCIPMVSLQKKNGGLWECVFLIDVASRFHLSASDVAARFHLYFNMHASKFHPAGVPGVTRNKT
jgi:hypothetical protein